MVLSTTSTATASAYINLIYNCSACGTRNVFLSQTTSEASTDLDVFGNPRDSNYKTKAKLSAYRKALALVGTKDIRLICKAGLVCQCRKCGHREPWAKTNFNSLKKKCIDILPFTFSCVVSFVPGIPFWSRLLFFTPGFIILGILLYMFFSFRHNLALSQNLPETSIPQVILHEREHFKQLREELLREQKAAHPGTSQPNPASGSVPNSYSNPNILPLTTPQTPPAGGWVCTCGRAYAAYVSSCVCGVSKQEAKLQAAKSHENTNS